jgi:glycosyltransferase involved in cell wall biosynthesis
MSKAPVVSAVSAFYNRGPYVASSVGSLLTQSLAELEIIIVDDGSTDDTAAELAKLADPRLHVIAQDNAGFVVSMNRAIRASRGRYVAVHGSGDISLPERLERQAAYLDANPDVGVLGCAIGSQGRVWGKQIDRAPLLEKALESNPFAHGEVMFRRDLFDKVGGYREIFRFAQDRDLWLRMGRHCNYAVLGEKLYDRFYLPDGVGRNAEKVFLQMKFAQFAVQCAGDVDEKGRDPVDRHGPASLLMMKPSSVVADKLALGGLRWIRDGRVEGARFLCRRAWEEGKTLRSLGALIGGRVAASPTLARLLQRLLERLTFVPGPTTPQNADAQGASGSGRPSTAA